jgi:uncharacterized protein YkwD
VKEPPSLASLVGFLLGFGLALALFMPAHAEESLDSLSLVDAVNEVRAEHHLRVLDTRLELARVAQAHAEDMAQRDYLSHVNPEGLNPLDRARAAGVEGFRLLAENIGATSVHEDPYRAVLLEWLASPVHRENLLHPAFNTTGLGIARTPDGRTIYVQLYASY